MMNENKNPFIRSKHKLIPWDLIPGKLPEPKLLLPDPEILFITTYPPRECGIATYSQDLVKALRNKFGNSFLVKICPLESENEKHEYADEIKYVLNIDEQMAYPRLATIINADPAVRIVMIQHEFGLFDKKEKEFMDFLVSLRKPIIIAFHTVLPGPGPALKLKVQEIAAAANSIIVMTRSSEKVLLDEYELPPEKISVIPHGTHLVPHLDKKILKKKYGLTGRKVLSTFGLLSSGKNIETTLDALPSIVAKHPEVLFLIIGKTHPSVIKQEGQAYRKMLEEKVIALQLQSAVRFINCFLPLPDLLEYLQLTDVYLFTSRNPAQAVSGTFSYAISCGCPVISTPIPHAREVLMNDAGIIIDFENPLQLSEAVNNLLQDEQLRKNISSNGLHRMASTAWENAAITHALLFERITGSGIGLHYALPPINLTHIKKLTTGFGMIQFSKINEPDKNSGYTLDDNARALIAICQHFALTKDEADIPYIRIYLDFISYCLRPDGYFLNYINEAKQFTQQNASDDLADSNGRAIWALGYLVSLDGLIPAELAADAAATLQKSLSHVNEIRSTRAMAFAIKGLYYRNTVIKSIRGLSLIRQLANRLVQMYRHEAGDEWLWFESYLTYANSILPEAMLCAYLATGDNTYKDIGKTSFDFLLSKTFKNDSIQVISNKTWLRKDEDTGPVKNGGEQPIDVAYTVLALHKFHDVFEDGNYLQKMEISFSWFLGNNHLHQVIYNPCTGGCYDGLEEHYVNLNQGAESTISYLMARLTVEKSLPEQQILGKALLETGLRKQLV